MMRRVKRKVRKKVRGMSARKPGKGMTEYDSAKILKRFGIPVARSELCTSAPEAAREAGKMGYPVAMKLMSPDLLHKSDFGGVFVNVEKSDVRKRYDELVRSAGKRDKKAEIQGVLVQEMVKGEDLRECIIGGKTDPTFGPVIMFGLGGVWVEVMKDVSFRIVPVDTGQARAMISEIRGAKILQDVRGKRPVDLEALEKAITGASRMMEEHPGIREFDINPLFAGPEGVKAADARIIKSG